jgi:hypothetical protein
VIPHRAGHVQVIAYAGAGKTEAISRRVSALIEEGVEPAQIVAFTFTNWAAESLKNRVTRWVAEAKGEAFLDRLGPMFIATFHMIRATVADARATTPGNLLVLGAADTLARCRCSGPRLSKASPEAFGQAVVFAVVNDPHITQPVENLPGIQNLKLTPGKVTKCGVG